MSVKFGSRPNAGSRVGAMLRLLIMCALLLIGSLVRALGFWFALLLIGFWCALLLIGWFIKLESSEKEAVARSVKRRLSYYLPNEFTDAAIGCAEDRIYAPNIRDLLQQEPGAVERHLGVENKTHARKIIDALVRVLHDEFSPMEVYVGGSFKKNTALKQSWDIDLVMKLNDFTPIRLRSYYYRARSALRQKFGAAVTFIGEAEEPFCVLTFVVAGALKFDVVTTGDPGKKDRQILSISSISIGQSIFTIDQFYSAATSHIADTKLIEFMEAHGIFRALVLLCKYWAYQMDAAAKRPKSYFLELYAMEAIRRLGNNATLPRAFMYFLEMLAGWHGVISVDNLNPTAEPKRVRLIGQRSPGARGRLRRGRAELRALKKAA